MSKIYNTKVKQTKVKTEKKKNWLISSGSSKYGIDNANILNNYTKTELGDYIKSHVYELINHFITMQSLDDCGGKIWSFLKESCKSLDDLDYDELKLEIEKITKELSKYDGYTVVKQFNSFGSDDSFANISKLSTPFHLLNEDDN